MDVRELKYPDNHFDLAIDKSTIDALLCGESSYINVAKMMKEVQRTLKENGVYMAISYGKPENRMLHFEREHLDLDISVFTVKKDSELDNHDLDKIHYVYICKKNKGADEAFKKNYDNVIYELEQQEMMDHELYEDDEEEEVGDDVIYYDERDFYKDVNFPEENTEYKKFYYQNPSANAFLNKNKDLVKNSNFEDLSSKIGLKSKVISNNEDILKKTSSSTSSKGIILPSIKK